MEHRSLLKLLSLAALSAALLVLLSSPAGAQYVSVLYGGSGYNLVNQDFQFYLYAYYANDTPITPIPGNDVVGRVEVLNTGPAGSLYWPTSGYTDGDGKILLGYRSPVEGQCYFKVRVHYGVEPGIDPRDLFFDTELAAGDLPWIYAHAPTPTPTPWPSAIIVSLLPITISPTPPPAPFGIAMGASPSQVTAGQTAGVTVLVKDGSGNPVPGAYIELSAKGPASDYVILYPSGTTDSSGKFYTDFITGSIPGDYTISAACTYNGTYMGTGSTPLKAIAGASPSTGPSISPTPTPTPAPTPVPNDNSSNNKPLKVYISANPSTIGPGKESTVTVEVWTDDMKRVEGASVIMACPEGTTLSPISGTTNATGTCAFTFKAPEAGNYTLNATAAKEGSAGGSAQMKVIVKGGDDLGCLLTILPIVLVIALVALALLAALFLLSRMTKLDLTVGKASVPADGKSTLPVTVRLVNFRGKPVKAREPVAVAMDATSGTIGGVTIPAGSTSVEATLTSSKEFGPVTINACAGKKTKSINIDFKYDAATLEVTANPPEIPADGTSTSVIEVKVKDQSGEVIVPLQEQAVELRSSLGSIQAAKIPPKAQSASAVFTAGKAGGDAIITALMGKVKGEARVRLRDTPRRHCMRCGFRITPDTTNCPNCHEVPTTPGIYVVKCVNCDENLPDPAKYCDKCGELQPVRVKPLPNDEKNKE